MAFAVEELDSKKHDRVAFDCGNEIPNRYLKKLVPQHRIKEIATTFVLIDSDQSTTILGYYTLSAATLSFENLTDADRKGLPAYPIPAVRIGRLAGSVSARGRGLGEMLLQNAIKRILQARSTLGVYAVVSRPETRRRMLSIADMVSVCVMPIAGNSILHLAPDESLRALL